MYAIFLKNRGYIVDPDPTRDEVQEAFATGAIKSFARHSRLGYTELLVSEFTAVIPEVDQISSIEVAPALFPAYGNPNMSSSVLSMS